jgi:hypothetical protein
VVIGGCARCATDRRPETGREIIRVLVRRLRESDLRRVGLGVK